MDTTEQFNHFNKMNIKQLKNYCREHSISHYSNKAKYKIIELILANKELILAETLAKKELNIPQKQPQKNETKSQKGAKKNTLPFEVFLLRFLQLNDTDGRKVPNDLLSKELSKKKITDLRQLCKKFKIIMNNHKTKQNLINCIIDAYNKSSSNISNISNNAMKMNEIGPVSKYTEIVKDSIKPIEPRLFQIDDDDDCIDDNENDQNNIKSDQIDIDNISVDSFDICWK